MLQTPHNTMILTLFNINYFWGLTEVSDNQFYKTNFNNLISYLLKINFFAVRK